MKAKKDEVRALLERIAATAGDPPEHGLDGVKARRRRRTRHRRGAVATAMTLAVFGMFVLPWLSARSNHDLTAASQQGAGTRPSAKLPDVVELRCLPESIDVPIGSARPQPDGMHLRISNERSVDTEVWVTHEAGWSTGRFTVEPGTREVVVSPPPGGLNVGCDAGKEDAAREVDLVDLDHVHSDNSLDCPEGDPKLDPTPIEVPTESRSLAAAAREALGDRVEGDDIRPLNGYRKWLYTTPMADPAVRVVRDGDTIAIVHITGTVPEELVNVEDPGPTMKPKWLNIHLIEYCDAFLDRGTAEDSEAGSQPPE